MTEGVAERGTAHRAASTLAFVLPGLPQLLAGRKRGALALGAWVAVWMVLWLRWSAVRAALGGGRGSGAVTILGITLVAVWVWSWRARADVGPAAQERASDTWGGPVVVGVGALAAIVLAALLAPLLTDFDPYVGGSIRSERLIGPSSAHLLGTDRLARDVFTRILYGARISLTIGLVAAGLAATLGTMAGAVAGYVGGLVDSVIMRTVDIVLAFPRLVLLISIVAIVRPSVPLIVVILALTQWPSTARLVRGEVLSLKERDFIVAARALGMSRSRIITRHLVPNALGPVIVATTLGVGHAIVLEAGLSFLGIGLSPSIPSWGNMVAEGRENLLEAWWLSTFPGLAIVVTVLAINLVGDGLRDALDPRAHAP